MPTPIRALQVLRLGVTYLIGGAQDAELRSVGSGWVVDVRVPLISLPRDVRERQLVLVQWETDDGKWEGYARARAQSREAVDADGHVRVIFEGAEPIRAKQLRRSATQSSQNQPGRNCALRGPFQKRDKDRTLVHNANPSTGTGSS